LLRDIGPLIVCLFFVAVGGVCVFWPEAVQRVAVKYAISYRSRGLSRWTPFSGWVEGRSYLIAVRMIGAISLAVGLLGGYIVLRQA
jgi:hypothetical protein